MQGHITLDRQAFSATEQVAKVMPRGTQDRFFAPHGAGLRPVEKLHMVFMTQFYPSFTYPIRRQLKTLIYSALATSRA